MTTPTGIGSDPLANAVLAELADTHGTDTPLGSFARTVLSGQAGLRDAAGNPWHGEALGRAFTAAANAQQDLSPEARAAIDQAVRRLAESASTGTAETDTSHPSPDHDDSARDGRP